VSSQIIPTNPVQGNATTSSVRDNFLAAHDEINALQRMSTEVKLTGSSDGVSYTATFTDAVVLGEGVRVSVEINTVNTNTAPTLNANGTGDKTIVRQDGSALVAGDLKAGQYVDLMYAATGVSGISDKWVWLNSQQDNLFKTVLDIVYPIGHILTTVKSGNPGDSSYFYAGLEFGTWVAFAKGRTIVGLNSGYTPSAATASADDVIQLTFTASEGESGQLHPFGVGDTITTSGFTTSQANVTSGTVTEATANTIKYASSSSISSGATVTIGSGKVVNTAMDTALEAGGAANHVLTIAEIPSHTHTYTDGHGSDGNVGDEPFEGQQEDFRTSGSTGGDGAHNNLQPYITTYIWKRTA
jgi:hypothetical protein